MKLYLQIFVKFSKHTLKPSTLPKTTIAINMHKYSKIRSVCCHGNSNA